VPLAREAGLGYVVNSLLSAEREILAHSSAGSEAYLGLTEATRVAYDAALDYCVSTAEVSDELTRLRPGDQLLGSLRDVLLAETLEPAFDTLRNRVADCVRARGYRFTGPDDIHDSAEIAVLQIIGDVSAGAADAEARFTSALAREAQMAAAEAGCRTESMDGIAQYLQPAFNEWLAHNEQLVDDVVAQL
jgi:hypothetical protein